MVTMLLTIVLPFLWLFSFPYAASFNHVSHFDRRQQSCPSVHLASPREDLETTTARISGPAVSHQSSKTNHDKIMPKAPVSSPYNLLWSPGMFRKLAWTGLGLAVAHHSLPRLIPATLLQGIGQYKIFTFLSASNSPMHCWIHQLALPMLASACCLLQLMLNALSIGCAGFNKHLGPVRPYFVGLLLYLSIIADAAGSNGWRIFFRRRPPVQLMLRWTVALLPELLFAWDRFVFLGRSLWNNKVLSDDGITATTITLSVPTMGCIACVNAIQNAVSRVEGVESVSSHLTQTGGETVVRLSSSPGDGPVLAATEQTIVKVIADSGFPGAKVIAKTT